MIQINNIKSQDDGAPEFTNYAEDGIYRIDVLIILKDRYKNDERAQCVTDDLKLRKVVAKFYHPRLANHHDQLLEKLEPYLKKSEENCPVPDPEPPTTQTPSTITPKIETSTSSITIITDKPDPPKSDSNTVIIVIGVLIAAAALISAGIIFYKKRQSDYSAPSERMQQQHE